MILSFPAGAERKIIMKKRIISLMLAACSVLVLCTSVFAAEAKTFAHWNVYVENGGLYCRGSGVAAADTTAPVFQPTWLPEGWTLDAAHIYNGVFPKVNLFPETNWTYSNGEESLSLRCCAPSAYYFTNWLDEDDSVNTPKKATKIQGYPALFWQAKQTSALAWEDSQGRLFLFLHTGSLTQADLEKIAGSVAELTAPMPEYHLGWAPEQSGMSTVTRMPGYMRDIGKSPDYIRFFYATQPLTAPEGTPEAVTVQGVQAQLWLGDPNAAGVIVTSAITGRTAEIPTSDTWSTLIWTDPETGICFCIQGHKLAKETMLRMAESVALSQAEPTATQPAAASTPVSAANTTGATGAADPNASRQSWVADGWKAVITHADGTVENVPTFSELFPGQELPAG